MPLKNLLNKTTACQKVCHLDASPLTRFLICAKNLKKLLTKGENKRILCVR